MIERPAPQRRLNPFAFPAETDARFMLLVVAAFALAVNMSVLLRNVFTSEGEQSLPFVAAASAPDVNLPMDEFLTQTQIRSQKVAAESFRYLALPAGLTTGIFLLAFLIYRTHAIRINRKYGLVPLMLEKNESFYREVGQLAGIAGLSPPVIRVGKGLREQSGQAFGFRNSYVLRLDGGLRLLLRKAPGIFRATVLHEMAHIANSDVGRTYFAQALWTSAILLTIVPLMIALTIGLVESYSRKGAANLDLHRLFTQSLPYLLLTFLQGAAILAVVAIFRASLLRIREYYADWRAAVWGAEASLSDILRHNASRDIPGRKSRLWSLHPTPGERLGRLRDPTQLFRVSPDLMLIVGMLLAFVLSGSVDLLALGQGLGAAVTSAELLIHASLGDTGTALLTMVSFGVTIAAIMIPVFGIAYLISGTVGLQIQRAAVAEVVADQSGLDGYLRLLTFASLLALGMEAGFLIIPIALFSPRNLTSVLLVVVWFFSAIALTWMWLIYARFFSRRVLGNHAGEPPPRWKRRLLTLTLSGLFCLMYVPLIFGRILIVARQEQYLSGWISFLILSLLSALLFYFFTFAATWVLVKIARFVRPCRCPSCKQTTQHKYVAGRMCEHCGADLAPWLFVYSSGGAL